VTVFGWTAQAGGDHVFLTCKSHQATFPTKIAMIVWGLINTMAGRHQNEFETLVLPPATAALLQAAGFLSPGKHLIDQCWLYEPGQLSVAPRMAISVPDLDPHDPDSHFLFALSRDDGMGPVWRWTELYDRDPIILRPLPA
jgi:hypothetical protein